jgi:hypothetical protein
MVPNLNSSTVSLSVAIIVPFLLLAFTVNGMRSKIRNSRRQLNFGMLNVESKWKKSWIVVVWLTYYLWYPIYMVLWFLKELTEALLWEPLQKLVWNMATRSWKRKIPESGNLPIATPALRRRSNQSVLDDPESQANGSGSPSGKEKVATEEVNEKSAEELRLSSD